RLTPTREPIRSWCDDYPYSHPGTHNLQGCQVSAPNARPPHSSISWGSAVSIGTAGLMIESLRPKYRADSESENHKPRRHERPALGLLEKPLLAAIIATLIDCTALLITLRPASGATISMIHFLYRGLGITEA